VGKSWLLLVTALLACASQASGRAADSESNPIEQFTRHDEFGTIKISPDGEFVALTTGKYGRTLLTFISLKDMKLVSGVRAPDGFEIDDFRWVSATRLIYMIAERQLGRVQPTPTGEIFGIDRDGKHHLLLYGYRAGQDSLGTRVTGRQASYASADLISALNADDRNILIAEHPWREAGNYWHYDPDAPPRVVLLNTFNGKKKYLGTVPLANASVIVDRNDQVRFGVGMNEKFKLAVTWKPTPEAPWTAFDLPGFRDESIVPQRFSTDNRSVLFTGVHEGESFSALYRLDLQTRVIDKVYGFEDSNVIDLVTDFADREVVGVRGYSDRPVYHWLVQDDPAAKLHAALQRGFAGQDVSITSTTADGRVAIAFVDSDTSPGDYYLFDTVTRKADHLRSAKEWINPKNMRPKQSIEFSARDGLKLHGYLTQPAGDAPHPLILLPHGGPYGVRDTREFDWEAQLLASRGYSVLQINFRGSEGYGMDFTNAGFRQWGGTMQDDLTDATHWAIEQRIAPKDRICIYGASYGGYAALMGAVKEPKLYRCAIGYAGVYDLELMFSSGDIPQWKGGRSYLDDVLGNDMAALHSRSPAYNAGKIEIPVLLIHGKEDWRADYEQAKRMKTALEKNRKKLEWMALSREGHGVYDEETRLEVYERILKFLDGNLMNPAAEKTSGGN